MRPTLDALCLRRALGDDRRGARPADPEQPDRRRAIELAAIETGRSRTRRRAPSAAASCAASCRRRRSGPAASTADAVREVAGSDRRWAALGAASAAEIYGCVVLREGVEDEAGNVTRFVWVAPAWDAGRRRRAVADDAQLLRARRRPSGRAGRGADRVLEPRRQPDPDRVAAASRGGAGPLHVLLRSRGTGSTTAQSAKRWRRCARRPRTCGCSAATRSGSRASPAPDREGGPTAASTICARWRTSLTPR